MPNQGGGVRFSSLGTRLVIILVVLGILVRFEVGVRDPLHAVDLNLDVSSVWKGVGHLVDGLFMDLHAVDGEAWPSVKLLVADMTFEVFRFLMLNQDFLVVKFSVAIPG